MSICHQRPPYKLISPTVKQHKWSLKKNGGSRENVLKNDISTTLLFMAFAPSINYNAELFSKSLSPSLGKK